MATRGGNNNNETLLLIEDDPNVARLERRHLEHSGFTVVIVETPEEAGSLIRKGSFDLIILEDDLAGGMNGLKFFDGLKTAGIHIPVIMVGRGNDEARRIQAFRKGAQDYLSKSVESLEYLPEAVKRVLAQEKIRKAAEDPSACLAGQDALTGLPNRSMIYDRLHQAMVHAQRTQRMVALVLLDLDRFKGINGTLGHAVGDLLLKAVAERLTRCVRETDTVGRFGGDEFAVTLTNLLRGHDAARVANKMIEALAHPFLLGGPELFITASLGITLFPSDEDSVEGLFKNAEVALSRAKETGRNQYQFFTDEMNAIAFSRLKLENSLHYALKREEFFIEYQPQVNLKTGKIVGAEALLRWRHPDLGIIPPSRFIPIAEETGLIVPMGEWVLRKACAQNKAWQAGGHPPIRVAVNLSGRQFKHPYLAGVLKTILKETGLDPKYLDLELTESTIMEKAEKTISLLKDISGIGIQFSIDDFGIGYSSLSYLKRFSVHFLKIDPSFIRDITSASTDASIVIAIISLAHRLNLTVIAEGVETEEQLAFLKKYRCNEIQGYLYSRPVSAKDFSNLLSSAFSPFKLSSSLPLNT